MTPSARDTVAADWLREFGYDEATVQRMMAVAASPSVYIVTGTTGEYSDRSEWTVAVYADLALAQRHADLAMEEEHRLLAAWFASGREPFEFRYKSHDDDAETKAMRVNRYDPSVRRDYTGTDYHACESGPLLVAIPSPAESQTGASVPQPEGET